MSKTAISYYLAGDYKIEETFDENFSSSFTLILTGTFTFAADVKLPAKPTLRAAGKSVDAAKAKVGLLDINTASEGELKAIPGVGDTYVKKIVAGRLYAQKGQLKSKKIIPDSLY